MKLKNTLQNFLFFAIMLLFVISSSVTFPLYFNGMMAVKYQNLPEPPIGIVIFPFISLIMGMLIILICSVLIFAKGKVIKFSFLIFKRNESFICRIIRVVGVYIEIKIIYDFINNCIELGYFFINGLWFSLSIFLFVLFLIIVLETLAVK